MEISFGGATTAGTSANTPLNFAFPKSKQTPLLSYDFINDENANSSPMLLGHKQSSALKVKDPELYSENQRLREALTKMKKIVDFLMDENRETKILLQGAYDYSKQKQMSDRKQPGRNRVFHQGLVATVTRHFIVSNQYVEYEIQVRFGQHATAEGHCISKRFRDFEFIYRRIQHVLQHNSQENESLSPSARKSLKSCVLPRKTWFKAPLDNEKFLVEREQQLNVFLTHLVEMGKRAGRGSALRAYLSEWLGVAQCDEEKVWCDERIRPLLEHQERVDQSRHSLAFQQMLEAHVAME